MISVLMVACNHAPYLEPAIRSVLSQTRSDWELVILDDGSTDDTAVTAQKITDPRIRFIRQERTGIIGAYRRGIGECKGEYLAFLEGDDRWREDNLDRKVKAFDAFPGISLAYSGVELDADAKTAAAKKSYLSRTASVPHGVPYDARFVCAAMNPVPTFSTAMVRREAALRFTCPSERFSPWLDWFFWNQAASQGPFLFIPERLVYWRHHASSLYARQRFLPAKATELWLRGVFFAHTAGRRRRW